VNKLPIVAEHFPKEVAKHSMTVLLNQGLYRHLRFAHGDSSTMAFDLLTYPVGLLIRGDMGCYVFERNGSEDMFGFFRDDGKGSRINPDYWAEKCTAQSVWGNGIEEYDSDTARGDILSWLAESQDMPEDMMHEIMGRLDFDSEMELRQSMAHEDACGGWNFDFGDVDEWWLSTWTVCYLWCLHAIVWGIEQYDRATQEPHHG